MKAELVPENGDPPIPIVKDVTVIGRREFCDVQIEDDSLSKRHCIVVNTDGLLIIRDLATTNGTKVKGQRIRWAALLPDDRITLGGYKLRVYLGPDEAPGPSELPASARSSRRSASSSRGNGFPDPSPIDLPVVHADNGALEVIEEDSDDSGWRNLLARKPGGDDDDILIELE